MFVYLVEQDGIQQVLRWIQQTFVRQAKRGAGHSVADIVDAVALVAVRLHHCVHHSHACVDYRQTSRICINQKMLRRNARTFRDRIKFTSTICALVIIVEQHPRSRSSACFHANANTRSHTRTHSLPTNTKRRQNKIKRTINRNGLRRRYYMGVRWPAKRS